MNISSRIIFCIICIHHDIRLFVHTTISLLSLWHWTYKMPVIYILSSVWVRLSIFSQLSIIQYVGLCVFSLPISLVMIEIIYIYIYTLSYHHHQIRSLNYYPLFRVRSSNNCMHCLSFYILMGVYFLNSPKVEMWDEKVCRNCWIQYWFKEMAYTLKWSLLIDDVTKWKRHWIHNNAWHGVIMWKRITTGHQLIPLAMICSFDIFFIVY